jgi:hypothetical protein
MTATAGACKCRPRGSKAYASICKVFYYGCYETSALLDNNLIATEISLVAAHPNSAEYALYAGSDASPVAGCYTLKHLLGKARIQNVSGPTKR